MNAHSIRRSVFLGALLSAALLTGACSKKPANDGAAAPADPATAPADPGAPVSKEDCEKQGGRVAGDIGNGQVACNAGEKSAGRVQLGIEGGLCCVPAGAEGTTAGGAGGGGW